MMGYMLLFFFKSIVTRKESCIKAVKTGNLEKQGIRLVIEEVLKISGV